MRTRLFSVLCSLLFVTATLGCSKKDDKGASKSVNSSKGSQSASSSKGDNGASKGSKPAPPTKEEMAKLDCEKACATQMACYKKGGMIEVTDDMKKMCITSCASAKAAYQSTVKKGYGAIRGATMLLMYGAGKCES